MTDFCTQGGEIMYANDISLNASSYSSVFAGSSGRIYVPVKNSVAVFTQFEYVRGTPASKGQEGVPVSRIRILNTLIDQLVSMKKDVPEDDLAPLTDAQLDSMIKSYQKEIQTAVATASLPGTYGFAGLMPEPGAGFSISA